jgi:Calpain family cysteine protease/Dockerin type I domain
VRNSSNQFHCRLRFERLEIRRLLAGDLPGDYNVDGVVDAGDFVVWRQLENQSVATPGEKADGNADGRIDQEDYALWSANFGRTLPDPEPDPTPLPNWFDLNLQDAALRSLGSTLYADALIDRGDIMAILESAQDGNAVDWVELADLQQIVGNFSLFGALDHVWKLSSYVVSGNAANAKYQGQALGNLAAGASAEHLEKLVGKWFMGLDRPATPHEYSLASGTLFVDGASYADVVQGALSNCAIMATLAETAARDPGTISSMFIVNGDGTYVVRFYGAGVAEYVTVDSYLPTSGGNLVYAQHGMSVNDSSNELWVALAEKAYAQVGELGGFGRQNSYASIQYLYAFTTLEQVTGQGTVGIAYTANSKSLSAFANAYHTGELICLMSNEAPPAGGIASNHAYAVVDYDAATQTVTLFNPWGIGYGLTTLTWNQVQANFLYFDRTA